MGTRSVGVRTWEIQEANLNPLLEPSRAASEESTRKGLDLLAEMRMSGPMQRYATTKRLVEILDGALSAGWFRKARMRGDGPKWYRVGGRCLYDLDEVDAWLKSQARLSTSDRGEFAKTAHERGGGEHAS